MSKRKVNINDTSIMSGVTKDAQKAICEYIWNGFDANATNVYLEYAALHLVWHLPEDQYKQCYHALAIEQMGANNDALRYMQWVAYQHPLDDSIQKCLEDMKGRI